MKNNPEKKSNFGLALDEIMKGKLGNSEVEEKVSSEDTNEDDKINEINDNENKTETAEDTYDNAKIMETKVNRNETSVILADVVINGSIKSKSNLIIKGRINGDVESQGNISMSGHVDGNVKGSSLISLEGSVHGNVSSENLVTISQASKVLGDISCNKLELDGNVIGNINTSGSLTIGSNSVIKGNIVSKSISILEGAKVRGNLEVVDDEEDGLQLGGEI